MKLLVVVLDHFFISDGMIKKEDAMNKPAKKKGGREIMLMVAILFRPVEFYKFLDIANCLAI
jgi:hypothetical protein